MNYYYFIFSFRVNCVQTNIIIIMAAKQSAGQFNRKMHLYAGSVLITIFLLTGMVQSQFPEKLVQNPCVSKTTCRDCIQTKSCAWCLQPDFGDKPRCFQPSLSPFAGGCPEEYTWNPDHEERLLIHDELTRAGSTAGEIAGGSASGGSSFGSYGESSQSSSGSFSSKSSSSSSSSGSSGFRGSSSSSGSSASFGSASGHGKIVQIYPQRVGLKLRISKCALHIF